MKLGKDIYDGSFNVDTICGNKGLTSNGKQGMYVDKIEHRASMSNGKQDIYVDNNCKWASFSLFAFLTDFCITAQISKLTD